MAPVTSCEHTLYNEPIKTQSIHEGVIHEVDAKCGKTSANELWLILVLLKIGWKSSASWKSQSCRLTLLSPLRCARSTLEQRASSDCSSVSVGPGFVLSISYNFKTDQVSKREKHLKPRSRRPSGFIVFEHLETWWNPKDGFLKFLLQQRKLV